MKRKLNTRLVTLALAAMSIFAATAAHAQQIRFYVQQSSGLFEILTGSGTGGRFAWSWRGWVDGMPVVGYTDRVARGERVYTRISGSGWAIAGVYSNAFAFYNWVYLPFGIFQTVSRDPRADNIFAQVWWSGGYNERRLPVGSRP